MSGLAISSASFGSPNVHTVYCASFQPLFGGKFCEQQLVLWKLLNTVKWSTFCVSFIRVLTIPGWLWCFEIFKIDYLVTPNVRFGTVSINPVTYLNTTVLQTMYYQTSYCSNKLQHVRKSGNHCCNFYFYQLPVSVGMPIIYYKLL